MIDTKFDGIVDNLRKRGGMYIVPYTFDGLIHFVFGYHQAIVDFGIEEDGLKGMQELVTLKYGRPCSLIRPMIIKQFFAKDDKEAITLFFQFYDQLSQLRKTKGVQFLKDQYERIYQRKRRTNINWPNKRSTVTTPANTAPDDNRAAAPASPQSHRQKP